jgi:hypothetical protein
MLEGVIRYANKRINQRETAKLLAQAAKMGADDGPPSPKILRERQMFNAKCFKGGNQAGHAGDAIGKLWLVGKLDIPGLDETRLLDAARRWWRGREEVFKGQQHKTARYERASRTSSETTKPNKLERDFYRYENMLRDADFDDCDALHDLMTARIDDVPCMWAARIIQTEVLKHFIMPVTVLACARDYDLLDAAKRAMVAMAGVEAIARDAA